jgi:MFS transporter, BCD family, chlorophyll transporter
LTSCMHLAAKDQSGLALGAWGAVQATSAGIAMALGGIARDVIDLITGTGVGYVSVYVFEALVLILTAYVLTPLLRREKPGEVLTPNRN